MRTFALPVVIALGFGLAACGHNVTQRAATGAVAGAVVAGPVGAAVGAAAGTATSVVLDDNPRPAPRRPRR